MEEGDIKPPTKNKETNDLQKKWILPDYKTYQNLSEKKCCLEIRY